MPRREKSQKADLELLKRVLEGQASAFREFHERYFRLVVACVRRVYVKHTVVVSQEDMDDSIGQVFLNLVKDDYHKLRLYNPQKGYKLSSWVGLISTNTAYDILRRKSLRTLSLDNDERPLPAPVSALPSPLEVLQEKEQRTLLLQAVKLLSENDQRFVSLLYEHQLTHTEISEQLGLSLNTVYSKKNKIKGKLITLIKKIQKEKP